MQYFDKRKVGQRIQDLRKSREITQSSLSEMLEYTNERQLQRIESGETGCSVDKLMEIAQILNTSTDYLLFDKDNGMAASEPEEAIFGMLSGRSPQEKEYVYRLVKTALDNLALIS